MSQTGSFAPDAFGGSVTSGRKWSQSGRRWQGDELKRLLSRAAFAPAVSCESAAAVSTGDTVKNNTR